MLGDYLSWIRLSARNGIVWSTLRLNVEWAPFLLVPLILTIGTRRDDRSELYLVAVLKRSVPDNVLGRRARFQAWRNAGSPAAVCANDLLFDRDSDPDESSARSLAANRLPGQLRLCPDGHAGFCSRAAGLLHFNRSSISSTARNFADVTQFSNQHPNETIKIGHYLTSA